MAETERENIRESTLEGLDTAAPKGQHGGRPPAITDDTLHTVLRRRAGGESVEQIQPDLIIPTGKRKGRESTSTGARQSQRGIPLRTESGGGWAEPAKTPYANNPRNGKTARRVANTA